MKRSTIFASASIAGLAVIIGIGVVSTQVKQEPGTAKPNENGSVETPSDVGGVAAPETQPTGIQKSGQASGLGPLQEDVDPAKVSAEFEEETDPNNPGFTKDEFTIHANEVARLTFRNTSATESDMKHNWVLVKPGTVGQIDVAAREAGPLNGWIPNSPDILAFTKTLSSGDSDTIIFRAPAESGDYPFICTFPGHAHNAGTLHVKAAK